MLFGLFAIGYLLIAQVSTSTGAPIRENSDINALSTLHETISTVVYTQGKSEESTSVLSTSIISLSTTTSSSPIIITTTIQPVPDARSHISHDFSPNDVSGFEFTEKIEPALDDTLHGQKSASNRPSRHESLLQTSSQAATTVTSYHPIETITVSPIAVDPRPRLHQTTSSSLPDSKPSATFIASAIAGTLSVLALIGYVIFLLTRMYRNRSDSEDGEESQRDDDLNKLYMIDEEKVIVPEPYDHDHTTNEPQAKDVEPELPAPIGQEIQNEYKHKDKVIEGDAEEYIEVKEEVKIEQVQEVPNVSEPSETQVEDLPTTISDNVEEVENPYIIAADTMMAMCSRDRFGAKQLIPSAFGLPSPNPNDPVQVSDVVPQLQLAESAQPTIVETIPPVQIIVENTCQDSTDNPLGSVRGPEGGLRPRVREMPPSPNLLTPNQARKIYREARKALAKREAEVRAENNKLLPSQGSQPTIPGLQVVVDASPAIDKPPAEPEFDPSADSELPYVSGSEEDSEGSLLDILSQFPMPPAFPPIPPNPDEMYNIDASIFYTEDVGDYDPRLIPSFADADEPESYEAALEESLDEFDGPIPLTKEVAALQPTTIVDQTVKRYEPIFAEVDIVLDDAPPCATLASVIIPEVEDDINRLPTFDDFAAEVKSDSNTKSNSYALFESPKESIKKTIKPPKTATFRRLANDQPHLTTTPKSILKLGKENCNPSSFRTEGQASSSRGLRIPFTDIDGKINQSTDRKDIRSPTRTPPKLFSKTNCDRRNETECDENLCESLAKQDTDDKVETVVSALTEFVTRNPESSRNPGVVGCVVELKRGQAVNKQLVASEMKRPTPEVATTPVRKLQRASPRGVFVKRARSPRLSTESIDSTEANPPSPRKAISFCSPERKTSRIAKATSPASPTISRIAKRTARSQEERNWFTTSKRRDSVSSVSSTSSRSLSRSPRSKLPESSIGQHMLPIVQRKLSVASIENKPQWK